MLRKRKAVEARIAEMEADLAAEAARGRRGDQDAGIGGIRPFNRSRRAGAGTRAGRRPTDRPRIGGQR